MIIYLNMDKNKKSVSGSLKSVLNQSSMKTFFWQFNLQFTALEVSVAHCKLLIRECMVKKLINMFVMTFLLKLNS